MKQENSLLTYSIRSGKPRTVKSILQIMRKILEKKEDKITLGKRPYRERERFNLPIIFSTPPGWSINIQLEDGLKMLLNKKIYYPNLRGNELKYLSKFIYNLNF